MAEQIVFDGRMRPTDADKVYVFDLVEAGLAEWAGMRLRVVPWGNPPWTDAELDGVVADFTAQDAPDEAGPWDEALNPPSDRFEFRGAGEVTTGPRRYDRWVRVVVGSGSDNRVTLARILPP